MKISPKIVSNKRPQDEFSDQIDKDSIDELNAKQIIENQSKRQKVARETGKPSNVDGDNKQVNKDTIICNDMKDFENIHKEFPNATIKVIIKSRRDNNLLRKTTGYCFYLEGFKGADKGDTCNHQVSLFKDDEWKLIEHSIYLNNDETPKYILKGTKEKPINYTDYSGIFGNGTTQCISYEVNNDDSQNLYEANEGCGLEINFRKSIVPITNDGKLVIHKYGGRVTTELHGDEKNPIIIKENSEVTHAKSYKYELDGRVYHYIGNVVFHDSVAWKVIQCEKYRITQNGKIEKEQSNSDGTLLNFNYSDYSEDEDETMSVIDALSYTIETNKKEIKPIECPDNVRRAMVFIRHGEPINNEQDVNIPVDFALPEGINVHDLFHGGAVRHIQTAKAISQKIGIQGNRKEWLNEYDLGKHSKKDFESEYHKIDNQVRVSLDALKEGDPRAKVGNETLDQFFNRNKSGLYDLIQDVKEKLIKNPSYKVTLVTSCGNLGFIELLLTSGGTFSDWPEKAKAYQYLKSKCFLDGKT